MTAGIDLSLFQAIHSQCNGDWLDQTAIFLTDNTQHIFFLGLFLLAIFTPKGRGWYPALLCFAGFVIAWHLSDEYLKPLFSRPRPFAEFSDLCTVGYRPHSTSFPSGHTLTSFAMAILIALNFRHILVQISAFAFALLIGWCRVYEGVHFPSDILGGMVFGMAIGALWYYLIKFSEPLSRIEKIPPTVT
ncbi:MAG: phosphatase PAP2 family protein [Candidatus Caenarcaniphilales bacterium]|nr:phosphatase PAP2 family protein [Candidatus Caenarcaniphilales bacterium]